MNTEHHNTPGVTEAAPVEPTEFEKTVATGLLGIENALRVFYSRFTGGYDVPDGIKLTTAIETCETANKRLRLLFGAALLRPDPGEKNKISFLKWPAQL